MKFWFEIIGSFPEREGKYLICPINSTTKTNYPLYRILEFLQYGDIIFHCILKKAGTNQNMITSYSKVKDSFSIIKQQDPLCSYPPPYRKVDLINNKPLLIPITIDKLEPYCMQLELIAKEENITRTPFDKNFKLKQLYISRIPFGFIGIFSELSKTTFDFGT